MKVDTVAEGVTLLRMDDGKVNAMGPRFIAAFRGAWTEATRHGHAVVLAGNAKAFSAGLDLKALPGLDAAGLLEFGRGFMGLFRDVLAYTRPVVAAVDGPAIAGGAILALCADFRVMGPKARIGVTEVPVGIPFPGPVASLVRARLPAPEHAPAVLRGVLRAGETTLATGWAHAFAPSERVVDEAVALATELAAHYPPAYASGKADAAALAGAFDEFVKRDAEAWVDLVGREETMEAIVAGFLRMSQNRA